MKALCPTTARGQECSGLITKNPFESGNLTGYRICRDKMINQLLIPQCQRHRELKSAQRTQTRTVTLHQQFGRIELFAQQFSATASVLDCAARGRRTPARRRPFSTTA